MQPFSFEDKRTVIFVYVVTILIVCFLDGYDSVMNNCILLHSKVLKMILYLFVFLFTKRQSYSTRNIEDLRILYDCQNILGNFT